MVGLALIAAAGIGGCRAIEKAEWRKRYLEADRGLSNITLTGEMSWKQSRPDGPDIELDEASIEARIIGSMENGRVEVRYPNGHQKQAEQLAQLLDQLLAYIQEEISAPLPGKVRLLLCLVEGRPRSIRFSIDLEAEGEQDVFTFPMVVDDPNETAEAMLLHNGPMPLYILVHELVELALVSPKIEPVALPDAQAPIGPFRYTSRNHTRWFRDGYASYAGFTAMQKQLSESAPSPSAEGQTPAMLHPTPCSSLAKVGSRIFRWDQYDPDDWNADYYNATLGMFLLIEKEHGRAAIRRMMRDLKGLDFPDGEAILDAANESLGADLKRLADDYTFPDWGLTCVSDNAAVRVVNVEPGSRADAAGLQENDRLLAINHRPTHVKAFYEAAVDRVRHDPAELTIERDGERITLDLPADPP